MKTCGFTPLSRNRLAACSASSNVEMNTLLGESPPPVYAAPPRNVIGPGFNAMMSGSASACGTTKCAVPRRPLPSLGRSRTPWELSTNIGAFERIKSLISR